MSNVLLISWDFVTILTLLALLLLMNISPAVSSRSVLRHSNKFPGDFGRPGITATRKIHSIRGGVQDDQDDERYSRQVYTLGARAHGLVRACTVYIDGPPSSGLTYECAKNLALSGVGNVVLWNSEESLDKNYHKQSLDDLGMSFQRAARSELHTQKETGTLTNERLLAEYIKRLNPSVKVTIKNRPSSLKTIHDEDRSRGIILSIDRPYSTQVKLDRLARKQNVAFVAVETAGVYGRIFCDFGPNFEVYDTDGETPLVTPLDHIELSNDEQEKQAGIFVVHCVQEEKHDVSKEDKIQFRSSNGEMMSEQCTVVKVLTPHRFMVQLDPSKNSPFLQNFVSRVNRDAQSFSRVKVPTNLSFLSLEETYQKNENSDELFTPCDFDKSFDEVRRNSVLSCFQALSEFVSIHNELPTLDDLENFKRLAVSQSLWDDKKALESKHLQNFLDTCAGKLVPLQAMFGAVAAQEVLKAATGLYSPVKQVLLYDCDELLRNENGRPPEPESLGCSSGLTYILGPKMAKRVKSTRLFVVGAGAIGCELLKNLAAMGSGTSKQGCIILTDMDTIEKSNLSRQLLFRDSDIGKFKSTAAESAVHRFNPKVNMEVHTSKVGDTDHGPFDDDFWSSGIGVVLNALDNMEARLFIDQQCVANSKALIDAGTLGAKGNVQVVVPHQSESYGSSIDPPEPAIPVCTLKNFPYAISHTIQWGRDLFDGLYQRRPRQANEYSPLLSSHGARNLAETLIRDLGDAAAIEAALELEEDLTFATLSDHTISKLREDAIAWAVGMAMKLFYHAIIELLREHPEDSLDDEGEPFWSGTRKVPEPLVFSPDPKDSTQKAINENLIDFVRTAARLRIEMLIGDTGASEVPEEEAQNALLSRRAEEREDCEAANGSRTEPIVLARLKAVPDGPRENLGTVEFEKDDGSNGHVQFVTAASNLRAMCYGIPPVDEMETRRIAGRIVPAMITTTALVSALSCLELLKLLQNVSLILHRNSFINLALPFFAFTVPLPAEEIPGPHGRKYTIWDRIVIDEKRKRRDSRGLTLKKFIKKVKREVTDEPENLEVAAVNAGHFMIYANFLHHEDQDILHQPIRDLIETAASEEGDEEFRDRAYHKSSDMKSSGNDLELTVIVEDTKTGEEYELPPVRVRSSFVGQASL